MSFFNIFKGKPKGPQVIDKVYMNQGAKDRAVSLMARSGNSPTFLVWSEINYQYYQKLLDEDVKIIDKVIPSRISENKIIFLEHHFSKKKELDFIKMLNHKEAIFINSLDDPFFEIFDSDRIKAVMKKMGHDENEAMEHEMIAKSIVKAQNKLLEEGLPEDCDEHLKQWYNSIK